MAESILANLDRELMAVRTSIWQAQSVSTLLAKYTRDEIGEHDKPMNIILSAEVAREVLEGGLAACSRLEELMQRAVSEQQSASERDGRAS